VLISSRVTNASGRRGLSIQAWNANTWDIKA
jgi:hypothetical protein